jgi:hypothetical protein
MKKNNLMKRMIVEAICEVFQVEEEVPSKEEEEDQ